MNVAELLNRSAARWPAVPALIEGTGRSRLVLSYRALYERVQCAAARLVAAGVHPGDRVLIAESPGINLFVALGAVLYVGATAMFIEPGHGRARAASLLAKHPPTAVVCSAWRRLVGSALVPAFRTIPVWCDCASRPSVWSPETEARHPCGSGRPVAVSPDAPALMSFTSGSGGAPKPLIRSHGFLRTQLEVLADVLPAQPGEVELVALPLFVLPNLARGVTTVLPVGLGAPSKANPRRWAQQIECERITRVFAPPAPLDALAAYCNRTHHTLSGVTQVVSGGAPVFPSRARRWSKITPRAQSCLVYGASEAEPIATTTSGPGEHHSRDSHVGGVRVGAPESGVIVAILREPHDTNRVLSPESFRTSCLGPGHIGEIVVTGDHVLAGDGPDKLRVGGQVWHRTGDAGWVDDAGELWLAGRCDAKVSGTRGPLYPLQVEAIASEFDAVDRAALTVRSGAATLLVKWHHEPSASELDELTARAVALGVVTVAGVTTLPMDRRHSSKVDYRALRESRDGDAPAARTRVLAYSWRNRTTL